MKVSIHRTSNLCAHVRKHHGAASCAEFAKWLSDKRRAFVSRNPRRISETRMNYRCSNVSLQKRFDAALVKFITQSLIPLRVVEQESFQELLQVLGFDQKGLKLMSRRTLGRRLEEAHAKFQRDLKELLAKPAWVATTADIWSGKKRSFLGMTVHWIDGEYKRRPVAGFAIRILLTE